MLCHVCMQGHFQIVLSNEHCPLFQKDLNWFQRLMYCSGVWSYIVGAITTPVFIAIPLVTIWAGVFPIVVSWWAAGVIELPAGNLGPFPIASNELEALAEVTTPTRHQLNGTCRFHEGILCVRASLHLK